MQLISLNAKVLIFLCIAINIINHIECVTHNDLNVSASSNSEAAIHPAEVPLAVDVSVEDAVPADTKKIVVNSVGTAKRLRNAVYGSRHNSYRSSYVGSKFDRRDAAAATQTADIDSNATEQVPLIKAKRKLYNEFNDEVKYNVGPGVNIGVEKDKELVSVYLDEDCLKDVFTGRGRNKDLVTKILPLFILPFLIQSAVVPFLVSTLKLLLIKSIVVGKIAIFLLLLSAFKNHVKYGYEAGPQFYPDVPNRRSEAHLTGYRVEGKPAMWVN